MSGEPCGSATYTLQLVIAVFTGLSTLLGVFLAHRRQVADRERRWFYRQMRYKHGLGADDLLPERRGGTKQDH